MLKYDKKWSEVPKGSKPLVLKRFSVSIKNPGGNNRNNFKTTHTQICAKHEIEDLLTRWQIKPDQIVKAFYGSHQLTF